jgi:prepilin-type N-terminal cleavage/methylation domain-containing protein
MKSPSTLEQIPVTRREIPRGVTMLELIVVIIILSIIMAVATPKIVKSMTVTRMRNEANYLKAAVKYLQGMAALQRVVYTIHIDLDKQSYHVTRGMARSDDFTLTTEDMIGGRSDSLFSGDTISYLPGVEDTYEDEMFLDEDEVIVTNRNIAGRVKIFDEEAHSMPTGIKIIKIIDGRGEEYTEGQYMLSLDPKGYSVDTLIRIGTENEYEPVYSVHVGANGIVRIDVEHRK